MSGSRLRVAVLDYGAANMVSISQAFVSAGADAIVAAGPADLAGTTIQTRRRRRKVQWATQVSAAPPIYG